MSSNVYEFGPIPITINTIKKGETIIKDKVAKDIEVFKINDFTNTTEDTQDIVIIDEDFEPNSEIDYQYKYVPSKNKYVKIDINKTKVKQERDEQKQIEEAQKLDNKIAKKHAQIIMKEIEEKSKEERRILRIKLKEEKELEKEKERENKKKEKEEKQKERDLKRKETEDARLLKEKRLEEIENEKRKQYEKNQIINKAYKLNPEIYNYTYEHYYKKHQIDL
jgi:hypothetical protein